MIDQNRKPATEQSAERQSCQKKLPELGENLEGKRSFINDFHPRGGIRVGHRSHGRELFKDLTDCVPAFLNLISQHIQFGDIPRNHRRFVGQLCDILGDPVHIVL